MQESLQTPSGTEYELQQRQATRSLSVAVDDGHVMIQINHFDEPQKGLQVLLTAEQARQLAQCCSISKSMNFWDVRNTPRNNFVELHYSGLPDGNSYLTVSCLLGKSPDVWVGLLLSEEDREAFIYALHDVANQVGLG
jgi:hypothetical protein